MVRILITILVLSLPVLPQSWGSWGSNNRWGFEEASLIPTAEHFLL
jgi:hypothetical protein